MIMKILAIRDSAQSGYVNMAADICSMELVRSGAAEAVFRTYTWKPHCLSIGRFQQPEREADVKKLLEDGFHIVRRPTGGRAVWHGHELTYSLVAGTDHPLVSGTIEESLKKVAAVLTEGLRMTGIPAVLNAGSRELSGEGRKYNPCFTSHGRFEIMTPDGRKLVGSAQARSHNVFIEHGSVIFTNQQTRAVDYLPAEASAPLRVKMRELLLNGVGTVLEYAPDTTTQSLAENLHTQFAVRCEAEPARFSSEDLPYLEEITKERQQIIEGY
jgi:lipoate-protein ligase A